MLRRFCVTFAVALVCDAAIGLVSGQTATLIFFPLWIALVIGWPYLSHKLGFDLPKVPTPRPPAPKRPLGVRFLRGIGKLALALFILLIVPGLPLSFSFYRAESTRRTLHVGMTEAEVLHLVKGWDSMWVVSRASGSDPAMRESLAVSFGPSGNGDYSTDNGKPEGRHLSESETLALLNEKLQGSDRWSFYYSYSTLTQMVYFSIAFGPDGHVTAIRPTAHSD